jgi:dolichol-phosphate mannosyltransferase
MVPSPVPPFELTVVVPTLNERDNIAALAERLSNVLSGLAWELIVVDDDSPDGTAAAAKSLAQRDARIRCLRRIGRRGLAGACLEGILASAAPTVAVMDADLQHDEAILPRMVELIRAGTADLVIATRNVAGGSSREGLTPVRRLGSDAAAQLSRLMIGPGISDPMSGFFVIRRDLVEEIAPKLATAGFKILADILSSLPRRPRIVEVPYAFRQRRAGESKLSGHVILDYAGLIAHRLTGGIIPVRFVSFAFVGASGVIVHVAVLWGVLSLLPERFTFAQAVATLAAMTWNFTINNLITYRDVRLSGLGFVAGLLKFYAICSVGALANVGVATWIFERPSAWWFAGLAGTAVGAVWNFAVSTTLVWRNAR